MSEKRQYRMRERAKSQEETRQRIVEATMHLHEEIGARATTISAIAERAGVQRLTVYRHFPDETAVFQACTSHWLHLNPPPDPAEWTGIADPLVRLRTALERFYDYYARTRRMWLVSHRDVADVPALQQPMEQFAEFVAGVGERLIFGSRGSRDAILATLKHSLVFPTWQNLEELGLDNPAKVDLVAGWVRGAES